MLTTSRKPLKSCYESTNSSGMPLSVIRNIRKIIFRNKIVHQLALEAAVDKYSAK